MPNLLNNYMQAASVILFGIGFMVLLLNNNMIKKIIGMNIMDTSIFLLFISIGFIDGKEAPIIVDAKVSGLGYVNPIPVGLMLTGIVVAVSVTAFMLALTIKLYETYGTIELDEIQMIKGGKYDT
ncbi:MULTISPECIES: sodium:proton antiporter [unclassified Fusibacter]|uniref:sodium:proton antiporter n=1 Tax=unclassified Fusibacter TaxID=2624464 RepID=UPI0014951001|nr:MULTISPECIES: cation:proton antiporter subunit C [unclassified Fusibacter]MCK8061080.1 cation:proton antiporter subunit C [Fusibacter sp. A2]